ncbi:MAG TPA: VWA domain-containing protein [Thermoplasmatales archaeon]|nr:VWA domain-containing protein [Thermoplasmatales archaeon]
MRGEDSAVSEIVGTILILLIAVSAFATVQYIILSSPTPSSGMIVNIVSRVEGTNIILEHHGGQPLDLNTEISISIGGEEKRMRIGDNLPEGAKEDGKWNLGERIVIPFEYDIDDLENYTNADVSAIDEKNNSIVFLGSINLNPVSDVGLKVAVNPKDPSVNSTVKATITVTCYRGDVGAADIDVKYILPDELTYIGNTTSNGTYCNYTGIWHIDKIEVGSSVNLTVTAKVNGLKYREFTQLAMILDGSGSISPEDWDLIRTGLANAVENPDVFPHDGSAELTVIQFGDYYHSTPHAELEVGPVVVTNVTGAPSYYKDVADGIRGIDQLGGATPMGCGIRLAADQLHDSENFSGDSRQIINIVTDGVPNCRWTTDTYTGTWMGPGDDQYVYGKESAEAAREYLLDTLGLTEDKDGFNSLAVLRGSEPPDIDWLNGTMVWPQPGYIAPPFDNGSGWVSKITSWQEFENAVNKMFRFIFNSITCTVEIVKLKPFDPNDVNNKVTVVITPQPR